MKKNYVSCGDCLTLLSDLPKESIDLVYLDPPFFTQKIHTLKSKNTPDSYSFVDKWDGIEYYIDFMLARLKECYRILKPSGSIFLHCDTTASHYLRCALDKIFHSNNFRSEIIWYYKRWSNSKKGLLNSHQTIFWYSKTSNYIFNPQYSTYSLTTNIDQIFQKRERHSTTNKTIYKSNNEKPEFNRKKGVPLSDVWEIPYLNPKAKERCGYPTQKPILLLEQIIEMASNVEDIICDPFCGSGTTLVAAKLLSRKYIGFDISQEAVDLSHTRLDNPVKTQSYLLSKGKDVFDNQSADVLKILENINAYPVQRNKGIDGFLRQGISIIPVPVKIQRDTETLAQAKQAALKAIKHHQYQHIFVIKTHEDNEMNFSELKEQEYANEKLTVIDKTNIAELDKLRELQVIN